MTIFIKRSPDRRRSNEVGSLAEAAGRASPGSPIIAEPGFWPGNVTFPPNVSIPGGSFGSLSLFGGTLANVTVVALTVLGGSVTLINVTVLTQATFVSGFTTATNLTVQRGMIVAGAAKLQILTKATVT